MKNNETFDVSHAQLKENFPVNDMDDLSWCLGCSFKRYKMEGVMEMTQAAFVGLVADHAPAAEEFDLGPKRIHKKDQ